MWNPQLIPGLGQTWRRPDILSGHMSRPLVLVPFLLLLTSSSLAHEALQRAACEGHVDEVTRLLAQPEVLGAIDAYEPHPALRIPVNPLGCAAMNGQDAVVKLLLEKGAAPGSLPEDGSSWGVMDALVLQRSRPRLNATLTVVLEHLRQKGLPLQKVGRYWMGLLLHPKRPWETGVIYEPTDDEALSTAKLLLDAGAKAEGGAVAVAAAHGFQKTLTLLLDAGGPPRDAVKASARRAQPEMLALALSRAPTESRAALAQAGLEELGDGPADRLTGILKQLVAAGGRIEETWCVAHASESVLGWMLEHGCTANMTASGDSMLQDAAEGPHAEQNVALLVARGADVKPWSRAILREVLEKNRPLPSFFGEWLSRAEELGLTQKDRDDLLTTAIYRNNVPAVRRLIALGANPLVRDSFDKQTLIDKARQRKLPEVVDALLDFFKPAGSTGENIELVLLLGGGATSAAEARSLVESWKFGAFTAPERRASQHELVKFTEGFPRGIDSGTVEGLKPGFHVVALGVCQPDEAEARLKALRGFMPGAYSRKVRVPKAWHGQCPQVGELVASASQAAPSGETLTLSAWRADEAWSGLLFVASTQKTGGSPLHLEVLPGMLRAHESDMVQTCNAEVTAGEVSPGQKGLRWKVRCESGTHYNCTYDNVTEAGAVGLGPAGLVTVRPTKPFYEGRRYSYCNTGE